MSAFSRLRHLLGQAWLAATMRSSRDYWERRYGLGMTSGSGSSGRLARFKAQVINNFVRQHGIRTVIEFGCGDGSQLELAEYPQYLGLDVSRTAVEACRRRFGGDPTKSFLLLDPLPGPRPQELPQADLTLSLDVIYHLLEDVVYRRHLERLFAASRRHVIIYSSNRVEAARARHVRHRNFLKDVESAFPDFALASRIDNPFPSESFADFYIFSRAGD